MIWFATPLADRHPPTVEQVCNEFGVPGAAALRVRSETTFAEHVASENSLFIGCTGDIKQAAIRNALDPKREDQWVWMKRCERMVGADFLPEE